MGWSPQACLLPQLDQLQVYNACNFSWNPQNFNNSPATAINATARNTTIASFLCPSDPHQDATRINSYHASMGPTTTQNPTAPSGMFGKYFCVGIRDVTDGTSNTVAFSEALMGVGGAGHGWRGNIATEATDSSPSCVVYNVASLATGVLLQAFNNCQQTFQSGKSGGTDQEDRGYRWTDGRVGYTLFNTVATPNDAQFPLNGCRIGPTYTGSDSEQISPATSMHSGGANVLFADGSVKFIKSTINRSTWWALGSRGDGEVVGADSF